MELLETGKMPNEEISKKPKKKKIDLIPRNRFEKAEIPKPSKIKRCKSTRAAQNKKEIIENDDNEIKMVYNTKYNAPINQTKATNKIDVNKMNKIYNDGLYNKRASR